MKAPVRLTQLKNINLYADKELLKNSAKHSKCFTININPDLYDKLLFESNKQQIVMAELIRRSIKNLLDNPNQLYNANLLTNNTKAISFMTELSMNKQMNDFKDVHKINKSNQIRQALYAYLFHEC